MTYIRETAKAWVGGIGAATATYVGLWTDDPRIAGLLTLVTAFAVYFVPNQTAE